MTLHVGVGFLLIGHRLDKIPGICVGAALGGDNPPTEDVITHPGILEPHILGDSILHSCRNERGQEVVF